MAAAGAAALCPVTSVGASCRAVVECAGGAVQIVPDGIEALADSLASLDLEAVRKETGWEECGWHFVDGGPLTAQYVFVLDSLNFCFWPTEGFEYEQLATALTEVLAKDRAAFSADRLAALTEAELAAWFPTHELPNASERVLRLRELGEVLLREAGGEAARFAAQAKGSAVTLVRRIIECLPGFRDTAVYRGRLVHFYKRAQIVVADLWAAFGRRTSDPGHYASFDDIGKLTMFADYRVPQLLRHVGALRYSAEVAEQIDGKKQIAFGSELETEIRAATVVAVERLQQRLAVKGVDVLVVEVDWLLWNQGEKDLDVMAPHHRTLTIYY
mmetsp:Transcript_10280/g.26343  ORF Transcript_10280/g.26343 Transcript_10280/m.26343 type:complete len:329 (+) Transcript_10280:43-1029(+)|eukprot:CAMPEP_0182919360 /NCGR_PEP_ID=MMETSP0105_2-20130417/2661_1 /TAXON_ID=81532 ORGANISM="Acanthoeca-like sp., Strain 10tr" /NCGR_SAMPLE_ID=MMETSP0105_2 /ASSEMBLY_ACC=CAM_ASM_000205 /LENGTH=328 /DNA_ID=CAMNT_0025056527 /DNA_START=42 /DNA_END=1028 /DNA_ORIENTATION=-